MWLRVAEVLVTPHRGQGVGREDLGYPLAEWGNREGVTVEEHQDIGGGGPLDDNGGELVELLLGEP